MAFATSNVKTNYLGSFNVTVGDWSGSAGDAPGTFPVKGGRVYFYNFGSDDGSGPQQVEVVCAASTSGAVTTLTVNNNMAVVAGRFFIVHS